jgi:MFS transporter, OFA family, oxalate/formate antiporter
LAAAVASMRNPSARWIYLALAAVAMVCIANLQYGWTLFVNPLADAHGWKKAAIQSAFALFVLLETWVVPFNGFVADRIGPKPMVAVGAILVAIGWVINAHTGSLNGLFLGEALSGIGAGVIYGTMVGIAVKWFPDRRGLAVGLTAAGFGAGAALTVIPIADMIKHGGYGAAFQTFGIIQGALVFVIAFFLRFPDAEETALLVRSAQNSVAITRQRQNSYTPWQMLSSPQFWLLYVMFVMIATGLLFITAQLGPMANDYAVASILPMALLIDNVVNGGSRVLFGWVSDHLGREVTMAIAFCCMALGLFGLLFANGSPVLFVISAAATFLASGEIFSLFPSSCTDIFGTKYATTNTGLLYTAKGTAALMVPLASLVRAETGSWAAMISILTFFTLLVAILAVAVLKPMRERAVAAERGEAVVSSVTTEAAPAHLISRKGIARPTTIIDASGPSSQTSRSHSRSARSREL